MTRECRSCEHAHKSIEENKRLYVFGVRNCKFLPVYRFVTGHYT